jgi:hypothetical protein
MEVTESNHGSDNASTKKSTDSKKGDKFRSIHNKIVNSMLGFNGRLPAFPAKLHRWVDHEGNSQIYLENGRGEVRYVADDHVHALIASYWDLCMEEMYGEEFWGHYAAEDGPKIRKLWLAKSPARSEKWRPLGWASTGELVLHKVNFDPITLGYETLENLCPTFHEFLSRSENHRALMAFVGSLFDPNSQRQQYVWIYGDGRNGKSSFIRALTSALGPVASYEQVPTDGAKHWTVGLRNKRLVVFADCNNASFVTTGLFKSLTGEDGIRVEPKGKPAYTEDIHAKIMFSSNTKPKISTTPADLERILFFDAKRVTKDFGHRYEDMLKAELKYFLPICYSVYLEETEGNPRRLIKLKNSSELDAAASSSEIEYETFCTEYIEKVQSDDDTPLSSRKHVKLRRMMEIMDHAGFKSRYERDKLRDYMERVHGITEKVIKAGGKSYRAYLDCQECPGSHQSKK